MTPPPQEEILRRPRSPTTLLSEFLCCSVMFLSVFFSVCFFKYEAIAIGVNSKEVHDTKFSEMLNNPFHRMITGSLDINFR